MMYTSMHFIRQWTKSSLIIDLCIVKGIQRSMCVKETAQGAQFLYSSATSSNKPSVCIQIIYSCTS